MKRFVSVLLLLCLLLGCVGCTEKEAPRRDLENWAGEGQFGLSAEDVTESLRQQGFTLEEGKAAGQKHRFHTCTLQPAEDTVFHGFALRQDSGVELRFTPVFTYRGEEIGSLFAGVEFTLTAEDSPAFLEWVHKELRGCPQVPPRESGVNGEVYLVRCYSELTQREYTDLARMTRQSRRQFGSETELLHDPLAMLEDSFSDHLEATRKGQQVGMFTVTLTENRWGEATVSVEAYGEALYRTLFM